MVAEWGSSFDPVVDQPQVALCKGINGLDVLEWGFATMGPTVAASPAGFMDEIQSRYGNHPVHLCDRVASGQRGHESLLAKLMKGLATKKALVLDLLGREDWTCSPVGSPNRTVSDTISGLITTRAIRDMMQLRAIG